MKCTKIFETESDYESFRIGDDWLRPNICVVKNSINIKYNSKLFPVKLITGNNDILGIEVYNYLIENNINGAFFNKIYVDGIHIPAVNQNTDASVTLTDRGETYYKLDNNGFVTKLDFLIIKNTG